MNIKPLFFASALGLLATSAWAQSSNKPLNLKLPANLPAASGTSAAPASSATTATATAATSASPATGSGAHPLANPPASATPPISTTPGVYYGDTSGQMGNTDTADSQRCDDSQYDKAQVHGAVSTGIASGSHMGTSTYQGATVNVTKAFGDCDHPGGGVSFSISVDQAHFNGGRYGSYRGY